MKATIKFLTGAAAAATLAVSAAAPAQAQSWDRRDRGVDVGDVIAGVAIVGGIAALVAALDNNNNRYAYSRPGYGHPGAGYAYAPVNRYGSAQAAVNACGHQAMRLGRNVQVTDIDRTNRGYRVRGRVDVLDYDGRGWNRRYDVDRERFTCYAVNGRVIDFRA